MNDAVQIKDELRRINKEIDDLEFERLKARKDLVESQTNYPSEIRRVEARNKIAGSLKNLRSLKERRSGLAKQLEDCRSM